MSIADNIVESIVEEDKNEYLKIRTEIITKKALTKAEFSNLVRLLETEPLQVLKMHSYFCASEIRVVSMALKRAKLEAPEDLIRYLIASSAKSSPVLLCTLLGKGYKSVPHEMAQYIDAMMQKQMYLCHYRILLEMTRRYPELVSSSVKEFCSRDTHPISKIILDELA